MEYEKKLILTLIGLNLVSWGYNALVAWLEEKGYHDGFVSLMVVVGVSYTVLATAWLIGSQALVTLTLAFVASGIPMIVGSISRYIRERREEEKYLINHARKLNGNGK